MGRNWTHSAWSDEDLKYKDTDTGLYIEWEADGDLGGYEWEHVAIVSRPKGDSMEYAVYADGGCSCSYAYEMKPDYYDFAWTDDADEVVRQAKAAMRDYSFFSAAQVAEESVTLRQWKKLQ